MRENRTFDRRPLMVARRAGGPLVATLLLAMCVATPLRAQAPTQAEQDFAFAEGLYGQENYELALQKYVAFIEANPAHANLPLALFRAGECAFRLGRHAEAAPWFEQVTTRFPESDEAEPAWLWLGDARFKAGEYESAAAAYASLLTKFPNSTHAPTAAYWRAESLYNLGRYEDAIAAYQDALGRNLTAHEVPYALYSIGLAYLQLDRPADAAAQFAQVVGQHADSPVAAESQYLLGRAHAAAGNEAEALRAYRAVVERHGASSFAPWAQFGIAGVHFRAGRYEEARAGYEAVLAQYPQSEVAAEARLRMADSLFHLQRWPEASVAYEAVTQIEASPWAPEALYWLGMTREKQGQPQEALAAYVRLVQGPAPSPRAGEAWLRIAAIKAAAGDAAGAQAAYATAAQQSSDPAQRQQAEAAMQWARYQADGSPEALAALEAIVRADPAAELAGELAARIGRARFDAGEYQQAAEVLELLRANHPQGARAAEGTWLLAASREHLGEAAAAETLYRDVMNAHADTPYAAYAAAALVSLEAGRGEIDAAAREVSWLEAHNAPAETLGFATYRLGEALRAAERTDEARAMYEKSLATDAQGPSAAWARVGLGWTALAGDPGAAEGAFEAVLRDFAESEAAPAAQEGLLAVGQARFEAEDYAGAEATYRKILAGEPGEGIAGQARYGLGWALLRADKPDEALVEFRAAASADIPEAMAADARYQAGRLLVERKQYADAVALLQALAAGADAERTPWALVLLGQAQHGLGQADAAAATLARVPTTWPEHSAVPAAQLELGRAYRKLGRAADAQTALRTAAGAGSPAIAVQAQYELAGALHDGGDVAGAAEEYLKVAILYRDPAWSAAAQFAAGQCYEELGQTDNALKSYQVIPRQYAEQTEWVTRAQERINALAQ